MAKRNADVKRRSLRKVDKRSKFVGITTTPANHRAWRKQARAAQKSLSSWIRDCLNGEPTTQPVPARQQATRADDTRTAAPAPGSP